MNGILLHSNHRHVSVIYVAIFTVMKKNNTTTIMKC